MDVSAVYAAAASFISAIFGGGMAVGATRARLTQIRSEQERVSTALIVHLAADERTQTDMVDRLGRIETNIDWIKDKLDNN